MSDSKTPSFVEADWLRLVRYLEGGLTPDEAQAVDRWLAERDDRTELFARLREEWDGAASVAGTARWDVDTAVEGLFAHVSATRSKEGRSRGILRHSALRREKQGWFGKYPLRGGRWPRPVGIIALCVLLAMVFSRHTTTTPGAMRTYATAVGQRATILLDDGTHVMLAPQTTLRIMQFDQNARTLVLDGEAYFEVVSSARAPFVVRTGATTTRVLGTAFAVRSYERDAEVRVAVASGKVIVSSGPRRPAMTVAARQVAVVTDSIQTVKGVENINAEIGWLGDQLIFQDAPMSKVLETLTRWYGYEFRCMDSTVVHETVTIGLSMRSSTEALATLERLLDVSLTVVGDTVTLTPVSERKAPDHQSKHYDVWVPTREVGR